MTNGEWAALIVSVGGGTGLAALAKVILYPAWRQRSSAPPAPSPHATREELTRVKEQLEEAIEAVEDALRSRIDDRVRELVERMHALALKMERVLATHEEREARESRRGGRR